jgi:repressor LexA
MEKILTSRQQKVLEFIKRKLTLSGVAPSLKEIAAELEVSSTRGIVKHLEALERKGIILRTSEDRGIKLAENILANFRSIPILGYANAGKPLVLAEEENLGTINIQKEMFANKQNLFAVIIKGDSMNLKEIDGVALEDGNYAVIDANDTEIRKDEVYLVVIDGCATVKSLELTPNSLILYPKSNNPIHSNFYAFPDSDISINGRVLSCLKNPNTL